MRPGKKRVVSPCCTTFYPLRPYNAVKTTSAVCIYTAQKQEGRGKEKGTLIPSHLLAGVGEKLLGPKLLHRSSLPPCSKKAFFPAPLCSILYCIVASDASSYSFFLPS